MQIFCNFSASFARPSSAVTNHLRRKGGGSKPPPYTKIVGIAVGEGLAPPEITVKLKPCGEVVKEQLQLIEARFPSVTIEDYVIMPDHIHAVIFLHEKAGGASPSPTLDDVVCAFKSCVAASKNLE